jgi:hypothetical protein
VRSERDVNTEILARPVAHDVSSATELASVLAETIRTLSATRFLHAAERDFAAWLQAELCKAREWTMIDLIAAWHHELDRRARQRDTMRSAVRRAA